MSAADTGWQVVRETVLERDGHRCMSCGETQRLHVHHVVPRSRGGGDDPGNLITLCEGCHAARHPRLQVSLARRAIERWALRLARLLAREGELPAEAESLGPALRAFGAERFRDGQMEVVLAALRGESLLAVRPTGSGKSLCFQLPALLRGGTAVVISPLKALMMDQVAGLQATKIPATFINSDISTAEKGQRLDLLDRGAFKLLYVAPERFDPRSVRNPAEIKRLTSLPISYMVVDEAHCIDRWGDDFRPSYGRLREVRRALGDPPVLAFTATAGVRTQRRILEALGVPNAPVYCAGVDRPNIAMVRLRNYAESVKITVTARLLRGLPKDGKAFVFVPTVREGEKVRAGLLERGLDIPFYHGKLDGLERDNLLGRLKGTLKPELSALICTNAVGMGIDIPNIRLVVHWLQPESAEDYLQEFGRAGRDGRPAVAVIFKSPNDTGLREFMARKSAEEATRAGRDGEAILQSRLESIRELNTMLWDSRSCFRRLMVEYFEGAARRPRRSLAARILAWLFGRRERVRPGWFCCDRCNPEWAKRLVTE